LTSAWGVVYFYGGYDDIAIAHAAGEPPSTRMPEQFTSAGIVGHNQNEILVEPLRLRKLYSSTPVFWMMISRPPAFFPANRLDSRLEPHRRRCNFGFSVVGL